MVRLAALWAVLLAALLLWIIVREDRLCSRGKVPIGRLRRLWLRSEQRQHPRYRVSCTVRYQRLQTLHSTNGQVRDLSHTGAGLVVPEKLPVGSLLSLEIAPPPDFGPLGRPPKAEPPPAAGAGGGVASSDHPAPLRVTGEVVWTKEVSPEGGRRFFIGIRFQGLSPEDQQVLAWLLPGK